MLADLVLAVNDSIPWALSTKLTHLVLNLSLRLMLSG